VLPDAWAILAWGDGSGLRSMKPPKRSCLNRNYSEKLFKDVSLTRRPHSCSETTVTRGVGGGTFVIPTRALIAGSGIAGVLSIRQRDRCAPSADVDTRCQVLLTEGSRPGECR
jgi:hypothetical protein